MIKSKEFPKNFLFGSREDYILKTQLESISAEREGNVEFTAQNTQSMHSTLAPPNTPWSPKDASQDHQDSHKGQKTRPNLEDGHHSSIKSQSKMASSSDENFEHWKMIAINSQKENQNLKSQLIEIKAQNKNLIDARNRREISKGSTETIWYALLQQNWQQVQRIKELEKDASFRNMDGQLEVRLSSKQIGSFMERMRLALESMMHKNGISLRTNMDIVDTNTDLQHLFHLLYGAETNLGLEKLMKNLDPQLLLRGLSLAAVKQWIFMTDFPVFEENRLSLAQMKVISQKGTATTEAMPAFESLVASEQPGKDLTCEVWRHASLYAYEIETASKLNDPAGMMIKPSNFIVHEAEVREKKSCLKSEVTLTRAVGMPMKKSIYEQNLDSGKEKRPNRGVKGHQINADVDNTANIGKFTTKNGLQRGIGPPIIDQTGRCSQEPLKQCGGTPRESSSYCSTCLNLYPEAVLEEHLKKRPVWCQAPCSICSGKYTRKSDIAKHKRHQKNQRVDAELSGTKKLKTSPLDFLVEVAKKKLDADRVTTVAKAELPQNNSGKSRQRSNRRSTRLNVQEGRALGVEDNMPPEVMNDSSPKANCNVPLEVEAEDLCDTSAVNETETRPVIPKSSSCEKCGAIFTSSEGVTRHQRMKSMVELRTVLIDELTNDLSL
ncbi:uncharacterized protein EAF02_005281 [Botrytis sinoallii]|uniref:uncharacterized protein n=1 Tax=Botrytis sinoallii TaxID=1463999 RepID=UPI0018FF3398|nr:uncharacterized protein EAF02_005281 [Botrytis sinoallii]KAF7883361.1 hypothetical protein EAF02_005281 [Botrytis sinoallii]